MKLIIFTLFIYLIYLSGCSTMTPEEKHNYGRNIKDTTLNSEYMSANNTKNNPCKDSLFLNFEKREYRQSYTKRI